MSKNLSKRGGQRGDVYRDNYDQVWLKKPPSTGYCARYSRWVCNVVHWTDNNVCSLVETALYSLMRAHRSVQYMEYNVQCTDSMQCADSVQCAACSVSSKGGMWVGCIFTAHSNWGKDSRWRNTLKEKYCTELHTPKIVNKTQTIYLRLLPHGFFIIDIYQTRWSRGCSINRLVIH